MRSAVQLFVRYSISGYIIKRCAAAATGREFEQLGTSSHTVCMPLVMGNSESKANDQGLLAGQISSYCLVCELPLQNTEISAHFLTLLHKANLEKNPVIEEFKLDGIRKVPKGYYCKFCNFYVRSLAKVNIHISSNRHCSLKLRNSNQLPNQNCTKLERINNHVVAFDCIKIELDAWNGVLTNTCLVCDIDVEDVRAHCALPDHEINLIQAYVLKKNFHLYRKLDEVSFQCLTCNSVVLKNFLCKHFDSKPHEIRLKAASDSRIIKKDVSNYDLNKKLFLNDYFDAPEGNLFGFCLMCFWDIGKGQISRHADFYHHFKMIELYKDWVEQKKWVKVEVANSEAIPLPSGTYDEFNKTSPKAENNNVLYESDKNNPKQSLHFGNLISDSIKNFVTVKHEGDCEQIANSNNNVESNESSKPEENCGMNNETKIDKENVSPNLDSQQPSTSQAGLTNEIPEQPIEDFAQEYGIKYKVKGITTCTICNERVRGTIEDMKAHIQNSKHKKKFFKTTRISRCNYETQRMQDFHKDSIAVNLVMQSHFIVNGTLCVETLSYQCLVPEGDNLKCVLCNKVLDDKKKAHHHNTDMHKRLWGNCLAITSFEKELVREVKSGVYHCGFCNVIFTVWDQLLEHLMSRRHKMYRLSAEKRYKFHITNNVVNQIGMFLQMVNNP